MNNETMNNIFPPPPHGNPNTDTKARSGALKSLYQAEKPAALNFKHCWIALEKTGAMSDQLKLFEARTAWDRLFCRILELEGAT